MKFKNIIWDWNGTLLNDIDICVNIVNELLINHGAAALQKTKYKSIFSFPVIDYYVKAGFDFDKESFKALSIKFISAYNNAVQHCQLHNYASHTLANFNKRGADQFILTAAYRDSVIDLLDHHNISHLFEDIAGLDNIHAASKVEKGVMMMNKHRLPTAQTLMIGDTLHDFEVAREMGISCVLIADGHQSEERLKDGVGAKHVLSGLSGLEEWIWK